MLRCDCVSGKPAQFKIKAQTLLYCSQGKNCRIVSFELAWGTMIIQSRACVRWFRLPFKLPSSLLVSLLLFCRRHVRWPFFFPGSRSSDERTSRREGAPPKAKNLLFLGSRRRVLLPTLFKKRPSLRSHWSTQMSVVNALLNKLEVSPGLIANAFHAPCLAEAAGSRPSPPSAAPRRSRPVAAACPPVR